MKGDHSGTGELPPPRATLVQLRTFEAVAPLGSVGGAARALHLAQPRVSTQLRGLDRAVDAIEQPRPDGGPRVLEMFARLQHRASVDTGAALVGLHALPRAGHVLSGQRLPQRVASPAVRVCMPRQLGFIAHGFGPGYYDLC